MFVMQISLTPLRRFLTLIPDIVHTRACCRIVNHLLTNQSVKSYLGQLDGKILRLTINDAHTRLCITFHSGLLCPAEDLHHNADIHIHGRLRNFLLLATRNADPDTMFFNRDLCLEGNTEDGLYIKNILDALEFDVESYLKTFVSNTLAACLAPRIQQLKPGVHISAWVKNSV